jgi:hypothetical protein
VLIQSNIRQVSVSLGFWLPIPVTILRLSMMVPQLRQPEERQLLQEELSQRHPLVV